MSPHAQHLPASSPAPADATRSCGAVDARAFVARRERERREHARLRQARTLASLPAVEETLRRLGASRVWVFGSVLGEAFDEASDLDLAVEGLPPCAFLPARVAVSDLAPVPFDLVELEGAPASLRAHILAEGRELRP